MSDAARLDRLATAAAAVLEVPLVIASRFAGVRQTVVAAYGLIEPLRSRRWTDAPSPMCRSVAEHGLPIVIQDRRRAAAIAPPAWGGFEVAGFACVPLLDDDGAPFGSLAAADSVRRIWRTRELIVLRAFADAVVAVLAPPRAAREAISSSSSG